MPFAKKFILAVLFLLIVAGGGLYLLRGKIFGQGDYVIRPDRIYEVKKADLQIGFTQMGTVNAVKNCELSLQAPFPTKLVWIIDENAHVKKADLVAKFETEALTTKIEDLKRSIDDTKKQQKVAEEELRMQTISNSTDIKTAEDSLETAEDAFSKYRRLEGPKQLDEQDILVSEAERKYADAVKAWQTQKDNILNSVFINNDEEDKAGQALLNLKQAMDKALQESEAAVLNRKIFKRHTHPDMLKTLTNQIGQAKLNLEKVKVNAVSKVSQKETEIQNLKTKIESFQTELAKHESYLPLMQITAPIDGVVLYGNPNARRWDDTGIKVGMNVERNEVVATIPDMSEMIVDFDLAENYRAKTKVGNNVFVKAGEKDKVKGKIKTIAPLPVNQFFWDRNSPKIYKTVIELESAKGFLSGMSVKVEVVTSNLPNTIFVPVEAVFEEEGRHIAYVQPPDGKPPEKRPLKLGAANENYVEIKDGLSEGEKVFLYKPFQETVK